jgi:nucleotide-binding universal stress UspA family protein
LARDYHAKLLILHVMMPSSSPLLQEPPPNPLKPLGSKEAVRQLPWPEPLDPQIRVERRLAEGNAAEEILRLIEAVRCDLVVMGTHGKTGLARLLTGSVAEEVLRNAPCGVLVVNTPHHVTPAAEPEAAVDLGEAVDVRFLGTSLASAHSRTLVRGTAVAVIRLIVRAGQAIPEHQRKGEIIVHCLEGRVALMALGKTQALEAGKLLVLPAGEPHAIKGLEDASLLLTILGPTP